MTNPRPGADDDPPAGSLRDPRIAPPPDGRTLAGPGASDPARVDRRALRSAGEAPARSYPFSAALDVTELDERFRPGPTWSARAAELSRSFLVFRSRRMCHLGRRLLVAVHLVDDRPVPLSGTVRQCEYDGDGLHRIRIDLLPVPEREAIRDWLDQR